MPSEHADAVTHLAEPQISTKLDQRQELPKLRLVPNMVQAPEHYAGLVNEKIKDISDAHHSARQALSGQGRLALGWNKPQHESHHILEVLPHLGNQILQHGPAHPLSSAKRWGADNNNGCVRRS